MGSPRRDHIKSGLYTAVVLKRDRPSGALVHGTVKDILANSPMHPDGLKVRIESGQAGRIRQVRF